MSKDRGKPNTFALGQILSQLEKQTGEQQARSLAAAAVFFGIDRDVSRILQRLVAEAKRVERSLVKATKPKTARKARS